MAIFKQKQANLAEAEADIQQLKDTIETMQRDFKVLRFTSFLRNFDLMFHVNQYVSSYYEKISI